MCPDSTSALCLVADIGGTNARFGLLHEGERKVGAVRVLRCEDYAGPVEAIRDYLAAVGAGHPSRIAIAIANPVTGDQVRMTNQRWAFSIEETRRTLGVERLLVCNDFSALAAAVPFLGADELRQVGGGSAVGGTPLAVIGPGTGLGVSGLVPSKTGWVPLAGEGGHVTYSPADDFEIEIVRTLRRDHEHVSAERLISGPGLSLLHAAIAQLRGMRREHLSAEQISASAAAGSDALCGETVDIFCAMLGTVAGNLALTLGARGGVYLGGGIVPRLGERLDRSLFRQRFEAKGRFAGYLSAIPTFVILADTPALVGAAELLAASDG